MTEQCKHEFFRGYCRYCDRADEDVAYQLQKDVEWLSADNKVMREALLEYGRAFRSNRYNYPKQATNLTRAKVRILDLAEILEAGELMNTNEEREREQYYEERAEEQRYYEQREAERIRSAACMDARQVVELLGMRLNDSYYVEVLLEELRRILVPKKNKE